VPVNSIVEVSEPRRYKFKCVEGLDLMGSDIITCNQSNGQWSPIPACGSNSASTTQIIVVVCIIVSIIILVLGSFSCYKRFVLLRLLIIPIKHKYH
jgi:Sushi repeat (SCR repeat)